MDGVSWPDPYAEKPRRRPFDLLRGFLSGTEREETTLGREYASQARNTYLKSFAPPIEDAPDRLRARVDELAAAGALDEGNGAIFDPMINSWVQQWHNNVDAEYDARRSLLELSRAEAVADLSRRRARVEWAQIELEEAERRVRELTDAPEPPPPRADSTSRPSRTAFLRQRRTVRRAGPE